MSVKNVVKVMNFHALLRVNNARKKVEKAYKYERELKYNISTIVNNKIFKQENVSLELKKDAPQLNIYIGSDLGFCSSFNSDIIKYIREDEDKNFKIIIGKRVKVTTNNTILYIDKEQFLNRYSEIYNAVFEGILKKKYSKINIIYIHYYNLNKQEILKRTIFPFDYYDDDSLKENDNRKINYNDNYVIEGDLSYIILNLISIYVSTEIKIAEAWSWASENVKRQVFTNESLKKIDEQEEIDKKIARKEKKEKDFRVIVEMNNRRNKKKEG